jgi:hypothetical protein
MVTSQDKFVFLRREASLWSAEEMKAEKERMDHSETTRKWCALFGRYKTCPNEMGPAWLSCLAYVIMSTRTPGHVALGLGG